MFVGLTDAEGNCLGNCAKDTSEIILFWDKVFDSINGNTLYPKEKELRYAVTRNSPHLGFWREARASIAKMYFQKEGTSEKHYPPSLKNWINTLYSFEKIHEVLLEKEISFFMPRVFNQDPIENLFGQIRAQGIRNINPCVRMFECHFKTLLLNNLASSHSVSANCEGENSKNLINSIKEFVTQEQPAIDITRNMKAPFKYSLETVHESIKFTDKISVAYVSGYITKNLKKVPSCQICTNNLFCRENETNEWHALIAEKEFLKSVPPKLKYCTPQIIKGLATCYYFIIKNIPFVANINNIYFIILQYLRENFSFDFSNYCMHIDEITFKIIEKFTKLCIFNWSNGINKTIQGKYTRRLSRNDILYEQALKIKNKQH